MMKNKNFRRQSNVVDDIAALRAFVMPELYPFLWEVYKKEGKTEAALEADIRSAREKYKELVGTVKKTTPVNTEPQADSSQKLCSSVVLPNPSVRLYEELH